jgi:hypothetical protein
MPVKHRATYVGICLVVVTLSACGGELGSDVPDQATRDVRPDVKTPESLPVADLPGFRRRCKSIDNNGALGEVYWPKHPKMTRERTETFTAEVTILGAPPQAQLRRDQALGHKSGIVMSCRVRARLRAPPQFDVSEPDWTERSFLQSDRATWSWFITPHRGGSYRIVLQLRPIVTVQEVATDGTVQRTVYAEDAASDTSAETSDIEEYPSTVDVAVPAADKAKGFMKDVTDFLKSVQGVVVALTLLMSSIFGLKALLRRRKRAHPSQ